MEKTRATKHSHIIAALVACATCDTNLSQKKPYLPRQSLMNRKVLRWHVLCSYSTESVRSSRRHNKNHNLQGEE